MRTGAKKEVVQRLMFKDFLNDPLAVRYFHSYLSVSNTDEDKGAPHGVRVRNDFNEDNLLFWEEVRRYRRAMSNATFQARRIFKTYVHPESSSALDFSEQMVKILYDEIFTSQVPATDTFDRAEQDVIEIMRMRYFPQFLDSDVCKGLVVAKKGLPKAIMVENEYGAEELEEIEDILGAQQPVELNLAMKTRSKTKRKGAVLGAENLQMTLSQSKRLNETGEVEELDNGILRQKTRG